MAFQYGMLMQLSMLLVLLLAATNAVAAATTRISAREEGADDGKAGGLMVKPNCSAKCGNIEIPYPFGIGDRHCYFKPAFQITCRNGSPAPRLMETRMIVTNISLEDGELQTTQLVNRVCFNATGAPRGDEDQINGGLSLYPPYTISGERNRMFVVGCDTWAQLVGSRDDQKYTTGCISKCDDNPGDDIPVDKNDTCSGMGCCRTKIPPLLNYLTLRVGSYYNHTKVNHFNPCGFAFVAKMDNFTFNKTSFQDLRKTYRVPLVLDWPIGAESCGNAEKNKKTYACKGYSTCKNTSSGYICRCKDGYQGNPYLEDSCRDINECALNSTLCKHGKCENKEGNYTCVCDSGYKNLDDITCIKVPSAKPLKISLGVSLSFCVLLGAMFWKYRERRIRRLNKIKQKYAEANGSLVLQKTMQRLDRSGKAPRIFTEHELKQATKNYAGSEKVGEGRYGIVYIGILKVGEEKHWHAIKKSKVKVQIDQNETTSPIHDQKQNTAPTGDLKQITQQQFIKQITQQRFIKEMIALYPIRHKNIVKFVGCCLDTAEPILVYEFMKKGTLYEHIHEKEGKEPLALAQRLKIAAETAEALAFLHHHQIIHCDVKTANILLDENWTAKLSGFGASRLGREDENQISTLVHRTVGYKDPEDLDSKSNTLTEKSDVYSFGVVLAELLSLDEEIEEGHFDVVRKAADLAKRCLKPKADERPSMEDVVAELNRLVRTMEQHPSGGGEADIPPSPKVGGSSASSASAGDTITSAE